MIYYSGDTEIQNWVKLKRFNSNQHLKLSLILIFESNLSLFFLSFSCDKFSVNSLSQTAYDIATFWGHRHIAGLLGRAADGCGRILPGADLHPHENYFSRETLDRQSGRRTDKVWLEAKQSDSETVYLLFSNLSPMVRTQQEDGSEAVRP